MGLATRGGAYSAILAAVIFNAIIIPLLIPIALKGVTYRPVGAGALLRRNLLWYGLGGVIAPFIGIKLIDLALDPLLGLVGITDLNQAEATRHRPNLDHPSTGRPMPMIRETVNALAACLVTFALCAVAYPAAVWGLAQAAFPEQAEGSLIYDRDRTVIGSSLVAQPFASDEVLPPPPLGGRLQRLGDRRLEPGDEEPRPPQEGRRAGRGPQGHAPTPRRRSTW